MIENTRKDIYECIKSDACLAGLQLIVGPYNIEAVKCAKQVLAIEYCDSWYHIRQVIIFFSSSPSRKYDFQALFQSGNSGVTIQLLLWLRVVYLLKKTC